MSQTETINKERNTIHQWTRMGTGAIKMHPYRTNMQFGCSLLYPESFNQLHGSNAARPYKT